MKTWSYIAGGLKTNVLSTQNSTFGQNKLSYNQGGLKIKDCKIEGPLYTVAVTVLMILILNEMFQV